MVSVNETRKPEGRPARGGLSWQTGDGDAARRLWRSGALLIGGGLVASGLRRRSLGGAVAAIAGEELIRQAWTGKGYLIRAMDAVRRSGEAQEIVSAVTVGRPVDETYRAWRHPGTLGRILEGVLGVEETRADRWRWHWQGPLGREMAGALFVAEEVRGERICWRSGPDAPWAVEALVSFRLAPARRGTEVRLRLRVTPPRVTGALVQLMGPLSGTLPSKVLRRFKSLVETGEIPASRPRPACRGAGRDD